MKDYKIGYEVIKTENDVKKTYCYITLQATDNIKKTLKETDKYIKYLLKEDKVDIRLMFVKNVSNNSIFDTLIDQYNSLPNTIWF